LIVKRHFASQQLVDFAAPCGIKEDNLFASRQPLAQVEVHLKLRLPGLAFLGPSLDPHVDPLRCDLFGRCDRSDGQRNSTAQRSGDQLDGACVDPRVVVSTLHLQ
jgi:hypothetical protein